MDATEEAQELRKQATINDLGVPRFLWFDAFVRWLGMHGMLKPTLSGKSDAATSS